MGYLNREVSSLSLSRVQDVMTNVIFLGGIETTNVQGTPLMNFTRRVFPQPEQMCDLILKSVPLDPQRDGI